MTKRKLYQEAIKEVSDNATLFYVKSKNLIEKGFIRYVVFATCNNIDDSNRTIIFGKLVGDRFIPMEGTTETDADANNFFTTKTHVMRHGEIPCFKCADSAVGKHLEAYFEGYEVESDEVITI